MASSSCDTKRCAEGSIFGAALAGKEFRAQSPLPPPSCFWWLLGHAARKSDPSCRYIGGDGWRDVLMVGLGRVGILRIRRMMGNNAVRNDGVEDELTCSWSHLDTVDDADQCRQDQTVQELRDTVGASPHSTFSIRRKSIERLKTV